MVDLDGMMCMWVVVRVRGGKCLLIGYMKLIECYCFWCVVGYEWEIFGIEIVWGVWCCICLDWENVYVYCYKDGLVRLCEWVNSCSGVCFLKVYEGSKVYYRFWCGVDYEWGI